MSTRPAGRVSGGCRTCGCTGTRGGLFKPDTPPEEIVRLLRVDPQTMEWGEGLPDEEGRAGGEQ